MVGAHGRLAHGVVRVGGRVAVLTVSTVFIGFAAAVPNPDWSVCT